MRGQIARIHRFGRTFGAISNVGKQKFDRKAHLGGASGPGSVLLRQYLNAARQKSAGFRSQGGLCGASPRGKMAPVNHKYIFRDLSPSKRQVYIKM